jgi:hypothetical protein
MGQIRLKSTKADIEARIVHLTEALDRYIVNRPHRGSQRVQPDIAESGAAHLLGEISALNRLLIGDALRVVPADFVFPYDGEYFTHLPKDHPASADAEMKGPGDRIVVNGMLMEMVDRSSAGEWRLRRVEASN